MTLFTTTLELNVAESNIFEIDLNTDLDPNDEVWFTAKYARADVTPVIQKTRSGGGIVDLDTPTGRCQVKILPTECDDLTGRALLYDAKVKKVDQDPDLIKTVAKGVIILIHPVNESAS